MNETEQSTEQALAASTETETLSLLDEIMEHTQLQRADESYDIAQQGISLFLKEMLKAENQGERVRKALVDDMIANLDEQLSIQLDQVLHNDKFQQLESAWRGLKFLVDRTDFRENNKVHMINISKSDLEMDFDDADELVESGLYKKAYTEEFGNFGGEPYGTIVANYEFDHSSPDIELMRNLSAVGAMSHAPVIAAASASFFGVDDIQELPKLNDISGIFEGPQYAKWNGFRETEDARYLGLTLPRFLLRLPYHETENPVKAFNYNETVTGHDSYCWGNTAFAFATRLTDSFANYRWCPNIIGPSSGGTMDDLPLHQYETMGDIQTKIPTEVLVSDRREYELAEAGFIPLTFRKGKDNAAFFSANSVQKPKYFGVGKDEKQAETDYKLGTQLPYMYVINRLAHYIKVIQRENIGSSKERIDIEEELNKWIRQFVNDSDGASDNTRGRYPLRSAQIMVDDVEGEPGFYKVSVKIKPHFKYMGADFTLSLAGKLDK